MKPVMFCRKRSGIFRRAHIWMKCVAFRARLGEEDAVVGDDADEKPGQARKAADEGRAVAGLELLEAGAVHQPRDDLAHVVGLAQVPRQDAVDLAADRRRLLRLLAVGRADAWLAPRFADDRARDLQGVGVVLGQVVGDAGDPGVDVRAAQLLRRDVLAGRRLHQRRAGEKDRARSL